MLAFRAPLVGIRLVAAATAVAGVFAFTPCETPPSAPALAVPAPVEPIEIRTQTVDVCDQRGVTAILIHGQFTSHRSTNENFAIELPGNDGSRYSAITDERGYFEMRIPREDFAAEDLCALPTEWDGFSDEEMTLRYRIEFER